MLIGKSGNSLTPFKQWYLFIVMCIGELLLVAFCFLSKKKDNQRYARKKQFTVHVD